METPRKILLVEDNPSDAFLVREVLETSSIGVDHAVDLGSARSKLQRERPDLIILDLNLPDSRGVETLTKIKDAAGKTPVVVLTGDETPETKAQALAAGAEVLVHKRNAGGDNLRQVVNLAMAQHKVMRTPTPVPSQQEINFATVMASMPLGVLVTEEDGRILFANERAATLLGRDPDALHQDGFGPIPLRERFVLADILRGDHSPHRVRLYSGRTAWNDRPARLILVQSSD